MVPIKKIVKVAIGMIDHWSEPGTAVDHLGLLGRVLLLRLLSGEEEIGGDAH